MGEMEKIHCGECVHGMLWGRMDGGSRTRGTTCMLLGPQWSTRDVTECSEYRARGKDKGETIGARVDAQAKAIGVPVKVKGSQPSDPSKTADYYRGSKGGKDHSTDVGV